MNTKAKYAPVICASEVAWNEKTAREQANERRAFVRAARNKVTTPTLFARVVAWLKSDI